jgi:putative membrane protein
VRSVASAAVLIRRVAALASLAGAAMALAVGCERRAARAPGESATANSAAASDDSERVTPAGGPGAISDPDILAEVSAAQESEIDAATLANRRASSSVVKAFAQQMLHEHGAMLDSLEQLGERLGMTPQTATTDTLASDDSSVAALETVSAEEFDRAFADSQIAAHQRQIESLAQRADAAGNPDLKRAIAGMSPMLERHLEAAKRLRQRLK